MCMTCVCVCIGEERTTFRFQNGGQMEEVAVCACVYDACIYMYMYRRRRKNFSLSEWLSNGKSRCFLKGMPSGHIW